MLFYKVEESVEDVAWEVTAVYLAGEGNASRGVGAWEKEVKAAKCVCVTKPATPVGNWSFIPLGALHTV